jgi:hypothetical protein
MRIALRILSTMVLEVTILIACAITSTQVIHASPHALRSPPATCGSYSDISSIPIDGSGNNQIGSISLLEDSCGNYKATTSALSPPERLSALVFDSTGASTPEATSYDATHVESNGLTASGTVCAEGEIIIDSNQGTKGNNLACY